MIMLVFVPDTVSKTWSLVAQRTLVVGSGAECVSLRVVATATGVQSRFWMLAEISGDGIALVRIDTKYADDSA